MGEADLEHKFLGALVGTAVGDAVGAAFEGKPAAEAATIEQAADAKELLTYTDDTHMMIGVAESLVRKQSFDGEHMAHVFIRNYKSEPWRGYGSGPPTVFRMIMSGEHWDKAADRLYSGGSYGNGAAMRIAPLALLYQSDLNMLREVSYRSSRITHSHPLGKEGAALQAFAVAMSATCEPGDNFNTGEFINTLIGLSQFEIYKRKLQSAGALLNAPDGAKVVSELGNSVEAFNSVPTAIYCFLSHRDSFKAAVLLAASLGGDADTIAAMAGAISGAYLGVESIPAGWRSKLENKQYIEELASVLFEVWQRWPKKSA
jgi:poly(ADP-ribose) glycohydrolase ARH3